MGFLIGLFTAVMVLDCIILVFLVLIQLPKKEAGAGLAFGAGATDALFGAGSGNVLTKVTKYAATAFFILAIFLSVMQSKYHTRSVSTFQENLGKVPKAPAGDFAPPQSATPPSSPSPLSTPSGTNVPLLNVPPIESTNAPVVAPTNAAPK